MFYNVETLKDHNKVFFDAMVDLKVAGWKSFSDASKAYTNHFFDKQFYDMDKVVEKTGNDMQTFVHRILS